MRNSAFLLAALFTVGCGGNSNNNGGMDMGPGDMAMAGEEPDMAAPPGIANGAKIHNGKAEVEGVTSDDFAILLINKDLVAVPVGGGSEQTISMGDVEFVTVVGKT